jgi:hypothetical protein
VAFLFIAALETEGTHEEPMSEWTHAREIAHQLAHQRKVRELRRERRSYLSRLHRERDVRGTNPHVDHAIAVVTRQLGAMARAAARRVCARVSTRRPVNRAARPIGVRRRSRTRPARATADPEPEPRRRTSSSGGASC